MCINPSHVWVRRGPKWEKTPVPCDKCKLCIRNRVDDWVGRCLAEADVSQHVATISLTYAPPEDWRDLSHRVINPRHFQLFMKRLRKAGHKVRYFVAGEYGELQGRAHFHAILFFTDLKPKPAGMAVPFLNRRGHAMDPEDSPRFCREIPQDEMVHIREWPHGHVLVDWSCTEKSIKYVCEYFLLGKITGWFSMSKKPALGAAWFADKAELNREYDVLPSSFEYLPPGGKAGKKYLMTGATRRDYLNAITTDRAKRPQLSEWVGRTFDKLERQAFIDSAVSGFDDRAFLDRQEPENRTRSRIVWEDGINAVRAEAWAVRLAQEWGFEDVEEFEAFAAAGGCENHPEYYRGTSEHVSDGASAASTRRRSAASSPRQPTRFDRQGRAIGSGYEPLAGVFDRAARSASGDAREAGTDLEACGDLQAEAGE